MAQYPTWAAGEDITADKLMSMLPQWFWKTGDTARNTTTTPADDPDLQVTLEAGATYHVEIWIYYSCAAAADIRTDWNFTGTATFNRTCLGLGTSVTESTPQGIMRSGVHGSATDVNYGDRGGSNQIFAYETAMITPSVGGLLTFRWAQQVSSGTNTTVHQQTRMRVDRMA